MLEEEEEEEEEREEEVVDEEDEEVVHGQNELYRLADGVGIGGWNSQHIRF